MRREELVCTLCPNGCEITVEADNSEILNVEGHECYEGMEYAEKEIFNPKRILTTTVKVRNGESPLVSVRTSSPISRDKLIPCMNKISNLTVGAPVKIGEVIAKNLCGEGENLIATRAVKSNQARNTSDR